MLNPKQPSSESRFIDLDHTHTTGESNPTVPKWTKPCFTLSSGKNGGLRVIASRKHMAEPNSTQRSHETTNHCEQMVHIGTDLT